MLRIAQTLNGQLLAAMERAFPDAAAAARQAGQGRAKHQVDRHQAAWGAGLERLHHPVTRRPG